MITKRIGLVAGLVLAIGLQFLPVPEGLEREGWMVASLALLMACWWATEAIPIPVTSLLPLVVLPLAGVLTTRQAGAEYFHPVVVLLFGGFFIALGLEKWGLHARIALNVVVRAGGQPRLLILGFMIAAAMLSMWISNTATTLMLTPIALSVAHAEMGEGDDAKGGVFGLALLLGVAYAASIGGVATPVGTPTNLIAMGWLAENADRHIGFAQWMAFGLPVTVIMVPVAWFILTRWVFPIDAGATAHAAAGVVRSRLDALGSITTPELRLAAVFAGVAVLWMTNGYIVQQLGVAHLIAIKGSSLDAVIAMSGAILLFLIPAGGPARKGAALMDWETTTKLPWGVVLLFGGGLSLALSIRSTGLAGWMGDQMAVVATLPMLAIMFALIVTIIFLTELTSNVATVTAFMPVIGALAIEAGVDPVLLAVPAAVAGSCAFMLPVATAPNAVVYGTGQVAMSDMIRAGLRINIAGILIIGGLGAVLAPRVFG